ncbi:MAG TPA: hypothetical protein VG709_01765, partial [Actinomycetota bacterium]|nr:hypothetical protein [Actinomycetota bacterium]
IERAAATRTALAERSAALERRDALRERVERLAEPFGGTLPDVDALEADAAHAADLERRLARLHADRDRLEESRADLQQCAVEIETSRRRAADIGEELAALAFDPEEHARLEKARHESRRLLEAASAEERTASDVLKEAESRVRELEARLEQVREIGARVRELRDEARMIDRVSSLLEGFRTFLYGRIMPQISRDAEALFRDLTNHEYEDLRIDEDTLAIEIADADRYYPIERFSGSEVDLANLALRVAISTHLSLMAGADVGLMVLDEVMAALDAERKDLFVQTIGKLSQRFHQLFVITHAEQVKDQFPAAIELRRIARRRSTAVLV